MKIKVSLARNLKCEDDGYYPKVYSISGIIVDNRK